MKHRFATLTEWLQWQEQLHPTEIELGLERTSEVYRRLGIRGIAANVFIVAGTNGKGSCVAFLDQLYRSAGYRVACYSSPHLLRYNERILIQGEQVSDAMLIDAFESIDRLREKISLTYFEFGTLTAFYLFAEYQLDVAILEVGMGGRLDATNIIDADVSLLTSIGLDHQAWLGDSREAIAFEKAGVFRPGQIAVCGERHPPDSIHREAYKHGVMLSQIGRDFDCTVSKHHWYWHDKHCDYKKLPLPVSVHPNQYRDYKKMPVDIHPIQIDNVASALEAASLFASELPFQRSDIEYAIGHYALPGRCQLISDSPQLWFDVAHNPQAIKVLVNTIKRVPANQTHVVLGFLIDKDVEAIVRLLEPQVDFWHLAAPFCDRALSADRLLEIIRRVSLKPASLYSSITEACRKAIASVTETDRIVVCGSFFTVSEAMADYCVKSL